jgi:hypothetical protein
MLNQLSATDDLEGFISGYIEAMLWSSTDGPEGEEVPMDRNFGPWDISDEALASIRRECTDFWQANESLIYGEPDVRGGDCFRAEQAGHDFWLTRAGHGAGFWDGDWPMNGDKLDSAVKGKYQYKNDSPYVGDDGKIYVM